MSDEHDDPRPYDPEELDDDVTSLREDNPEEEEARLEEEEEKVDELEDEVESADPTGEDELLRGAPEGYPTESNADIDEDPEPTNPA